MDSSPDGSPAAVWRRRAVAPIIGAYAGIEGVDAVMVSGSTARGDADRWSDVEVGVFWSRRPTRDDRLQVLVDGNDLQLESQSVGDEPPWYDHLLVGTHGARLLIEVIHARSLDVSRLLDRVIDDHDAQPSELDTITGIMNGRDVRGRHADAVGRWQRRAAVYPRGLKVAVIRREGRITQFWRWRMLVERDNPVLLAREFSRVCSQVLSVLMALNGRYCGHPSAFKRLDRVEAELPLAPAALAARLRTIFAAETAEGGQNWKL